MLHHLIRTQEQRVTESSTCSQDGIVRTLRNTAKYKRNVAKKHLGIPLIALAAPLIISVSVRSLLYGWWLKYSWRSFSSLSVQVRRFISIHSDENTLLKKAFKDNDPEIIRIYTPLESQSWS